MRFYQMNGEDVASALSSNAISGLPDQEILSTAEPKNKFFSLLKGIGSEIKQKFLLPDILPLICYAIVIIFSFLDRNWNLLVMTIAAAAISLASYFGLAGVLYYYHKRFQNRLGEKNHMVLVIRGGKEREISANELVIGDVLLLRKGMILHADARILAGENLYADENYVFSSSIPARKSCEPLNASNLLPEMQENMLWKGSFIAQGSGRAMVTALGEDCYIEKTGGRAVAKQHSWFYNKQNNIGQFASLAYILLVLISLLTAVVCTFRFVEIILVLGVMGSFIMLNPVSLLTEWNYYRTAEALYQKGAHIRNIEAFDGMSKEKNLYYSADELLEDRLTFEGMLPLSEDERSCLSYFALCVGRHPISAVMESPLAEHGLDYEQLDRNYPVYRSERDAKGTVFSVFANEGRSVVVASGYWENMLPFVGDLEDELHQKIQEAEACGKMVWLMAVAGISSIPNQLDFSVFSHSMKAMGLITFGISRNEETAEKIRELQKSKTRVFLVNSYHKRLGDSLSNLYGMDDCLSAPPERPCYTLPHLKKNPYVVYDSASPIAQERAHLVLFGELSPQEVIYRVKCMFCGIKRSLGFIACFSVLMIAAVLILFLQNASLEAILYPVLLMKLALVCPCYYLTETVGNCNQYNRSLVLGALCGLMGFISALFGFDAALCAAGLSAVLLCFTLLLSVRRLRPLRLKDLYILLAALVIVVLPCIFLGGNWMAMILFACFPPIASYIINLFY